MTDDDGAPHGLTIGKQYPALDARALDVLARLVAAGDDGEQLTGADLVAADVLLSLTLARPMYRPGGPAPYVLNTGWHRWEATRMLMEAPDALDDWEPPWWPPGALDELADVLAPAVGIGLARWCAASVAGLEVADANRWPHVPG